jgi:hypothetical protein
MKPDKLQDIVAIRAKRKLAEIQDSLAPSVPGPLTPQALAERVARQLQALPPERRRLLRAKVAWAVLDLNELATTLSGHLAAIRGELIKLNGHRAAIVAYGRQGPSRRRH